MTTRRDTTTTNERVVDAIQAMMRDGGELHEGQMVTDIVILARVENVTATDGRGRRTRWHPMHRMDDVRERGLIGQHHDDVIREGRDRC